MKTHTAAFTLLTAFGELARAAEALGLSVSCSLHARRGAERIDALTGNEGDGIEQITCHGSPHGHSRVTRHVTRGYPHRLVYLEGTEDLPEDDPRIAAETYHLPSCPHFRLPEDPK